MNFKSLEKKCLDAGIKEVEIYSVKTDGSGVSTFNGEVDANNVYSQNEMYIRGVYNNHIVSLYVENDSDDEIPFIVDRIIKNAEILESTDPYFIYGGDKSYPEDKKEVNDLNSLNQHEKIELCKKIESKIREASDCCTISSAGIYIEETTISIENSNGLSVKRSSVDAVATAQGVHTRNGESKPGYFQQRIRNFEDIDYDKLVKYAVNRPISSFGASSITSKSYPVVFENKAFISLFTCFQSMFFGNALVKKLCLLDGKLGSKVFGDNINIVDDPMLNKSFDKFPFDDEGVACKKKDVVKNGVLKTYLHNLTTAKMLNVEPTGNGFKESSVNVGVMMTNLYLESSDKSFDEMIAPIKDGVLITQLMGQHAGTNAISGSFNLQASGFKIENGKVTSPVTLIIVSGNIIDLLNNVLCIANDVEFGRFSSGSVYVKSLAISGK